MRYDGARQVYQDTSREAWIHFQDYLSATDATIMHVMLTFGPLTCEQVEDLCGLKHQTASAQIRHLYRAGLLEDAGRAKTRAGRPAITWRLADRGPTGTLF